MREILKYQRTLEKLDYSKGMDAGAPYLGRQNIAEVLTVGIWSTVLHNVEGKL